MKKWITILLGMFIMVSSIEAKNGENVTNKKRIINSYYKYNKTVNFIEKGIEFFVFIDGDFEFDARNNNRRIRINRDYNGRIRNIGNVTINYDFRGNVTRIGNVIIRYRRGFISNVGNLRIKYDKWNYPVFYGNVRNFYFNSGTRFDLSFGDICDYNDSYFYRNDFNRNYIQFREDNNFYYYRAKTNARIGKRSTIIKRRKPTSKIKNREYKEGKSNNLNKKNKFNNRSVNSRKNMESVNNSNRTKNSNSRNNISKRNTN